MGNLLDRMLFVILHKNVWDCIIIQKFRPQRQSAVGARAMPHKQDNPALVAGGVAGIFGIGFPHTAAVVGLPAEGAASSGKVLGSGLCGLLGLSIADFVVEHFDYLSFICAFIIAHFVGFVKG